MIAISDKISEEIQLRASSKVRTKQVLALSVHDLHMAELQRVLASGVAQLTHPVVFGSGGGEPIGFLGEEDEVLKKLQAIPLPKKRGTPRIILVKMVVTMCAKIADSFRYPTIRELQKLRKVILKTCDGKSDLDKRQITCCAAAKILCYHYDDNEGALLAISRTLSRNDISVSILKEGHSIGYKEYAVKLVMDE